MSESTRPSSPSTVAGAAAPDSASNGEPTAIRPFEIHVPPEQLDDLRRRLAATRWPTRELVDDRSQGVQLATMQALAATGRTTTTWAGSRRRLNALPQFTTEIDGQRDPLPARSVGATRTRCR